MQYVSRQSPYQFVPIKLWFWQNGFVSNHEKYSNHPELFPDFGSIATGKTIIMVQIDPKNDVLLLWENKLYGQLYCIKKTETENWSIKNTIKTFKGNQIDYNCNNRNFDQLYFR